MTIYPLRALRTLALHATGLDVCGGMKVDPDRDAVFAILDKLGAIQIDTLQMVARAHYLTIWSRIGAYTQELFDQLACAPDPETRRAFEGWFHAACFLPLQEYRYQIPRQRLVRENGHQWYTEWFAQPGNAELMQVILERIRLEGGLRASSIEGEKLQHGTWWNWRPEKMALEHLYAFGDVMISGRIKFQRIYDLTERVLPDWVDRTEPSAAERDCFWLERGAKALGVFLPRNAADYTWMKLGTARPLITQLIKEGRLVEVMGETTAGIQTLLIHRENLPLLEKAAAGEIRAQRTTFLNPFDNLWWAQGRDEAFWGFRQRLEAYYPAHKRVYGYFCLPILHQDRLVGRFDPKLERKTGLLRIKALYLEPGIQPDDLLISSVARSMRDFLQFHSARTLLIEKSDPAWFGEALFREIE